MPSTVRRALALAPRLLLGLGLVAQPAGGALCSFTNPDALPILPETSTSRLEVSGVLGTVSGVRVRLDGVQELFAGLFDIDVLLVSPTDDEIILMSLACLNSGPVNLTFSKDAATALPTSDPFSGGNCLSATYLPGDYHEDVPPGKYVLSSPPAPKPPPGGSYAGALTDLVGKNPNGTWTLFAASFSEDDLGSLASWQLLISADGCVLFTDGFESGDECWWSANAGGASCAPAARDSEEVGPKRETPGRSRGF